jgi:hypothetical protein
MGGDPSGRRPWRLLLLLGAAVVVVAFLLWWVWLPSQLGDPARQSLVVSNRTDVPLQIVQIAPDGTGSEIADIAAGSSVETYLSCAAAPLQALDAEGMVVASRPGSDACNLQMWIIQ